MILDKVIEALQEAKDHGIHGNRKVIVEQDYNGDTFEVKEINYDNKNITIKIW